MYSSGRNNRPISKEGEDLIGLEIKVLDKGFVRLVDYMGSDDSVLSLARRFIYDAKSDENLLKDFIVHRGISIFETISVVFQIKLPIYIMGQLVRHRTAKLNSFSGRYSQFEDCFNIPEKMRLQSFGNKQVGEGEVDNELNDLLRSKIENITNLSHRTYEELISRGLCRELSRIVLSQNIYTVIYWKMDFKNLLHFLRLRVAADAQEEIRDYALAICDVVSQSFPKCWRALAPMFVFCHSMTEKERTLIKKIEKKI